MTQTPHPTGRWPVRIGINPISWSNDDLPSLGGDTPLETALREGAAIGYQGFELGNKFPREPQALRAKLAEFGVACVSGWYSGQLAEGTLDDELKRCDAHMRKLQAQGCGVVVYGEVAGSIQGRIDTPLGKRPRFVSDAQWQGYARRLDAFGAHLRQTYGLRLAYHHHMGAYVESPEDVDRLMAQTSDNVGLLFDTGHAYFGATRNGAPADPVAQLSRHVHRVVHVHCKDVRAPLIGAACNDGWSFLNAVLAGAFTVPGDGCIDFEAVLRVLHDAGYAGWLVVEAEQDPAVAPPYVYAKKGYDTLAGIVRRIEAAAEAAA
ncbi:myo-inosose-2 dehydratase [Ralstonia solanacearum]|uniref:myo-inosose-2 dehydratase n=1 Tax=Ralstonia solanacearum TaxID=305 RepID=UPI0005C54BE7|nr:myo-inosose-2 dehydratase [Ralstonia solanacearum]MBB6591388.1 myo-inosose-2 dehydratase [Ralstonia solanacearum]MBB6595612.1 myo-inosose-2 dehydratase [Ralstonia solanacearum]MDB0540830.1 myo-inosose-2 dehydratase [Ralstonia solanacearum]MDB0551218.1 myo-inosose-2 dehydratase [Ralstonia solanacearum]MDB0557177.1 myo-inosose-2 dehydratase [Ralstonia solanacearum]